MQEQGVTHGAVQRAVQDVREGFANQIPRFGDHLAREIQFVALLECTEDFAEMAVRP